MQPGWVSLIKNTLTNIADFKRYWKLVTGFVSRVSTIPEIKEAQTIENMVKYLEAVSKHLAALKRLGVSDEELRIKAMELSVPLIQANLEAMIIARQMSTARPHQSPPQPEDRA